MKAIELTKEHKSKLLEMCKVLFPKYEWVFHHHDKGNPDTNKPHNFLPGFIFGFEKYEDGTTSENYHDVDIFIHWFEFCMIYLLDKLSYTPDILLNQELKNKHLIDCLYEQFKKLKVK